MWVAIFTPTPDINKWHMSLCNNSSDNKSYWIHSVNVKVSAQMTTVTYMHQSQPSLHLLLINLTVYPELWPGNHLIWCNATFNDYSLSCWEIIIGGSMTTHWWLKLYNGNVILSSIIYMTVVQWISFVNGTPAESVICCCFYLFSCL